jgi:hypothetical protein
MSDDRPAPMTPADCDLTDFKFMPLLVGRLRDSDLASEQTPEENWAAVLLWGASWHQVPAASLPDVDATIAKWAGYMMRGKIDARWKDVRKGAMRGFILCSDGRWYHSVVAEVAREAWTGKLKQRLKTECNRIKKHNERHGTRIPFPDFEGWLAAGCPVGQPLPVPSDTPPLSPATPPPCHLKNGSKGQGEGQGEGQGQGFPEFPSGLEPEAVGGAAPTPPPPPPPFRGDANLQAIPGHAVVPLASAWELPEEWGTDAEALGFTPPEILRESERFRQYWVSGKGAGTSRKVKGWRQSWSNWLAKAEPQRRTP